MPVPHSTDPATLRAQQQIYGRGQTPMRDSDGTVRALDVRPAGPETAGRHLDLIAERYGGPGLSRSITGLAATRGWSFARVAVRHGSEALQRHNAARAAFASIGPAQTGEQPVFAGRTVSAAATLRQSRGVEVPGQVRSRFPVSVGRVFDTVRVHDDPSSHVAAEALGARAFTIGRSIYMGAGAYQPSTQAGRHLLAHEVAHAIQQEGNAATPVEQRRVSSPGDTAEVEAETFADAVASDSRNVPSPRSGSTSSAHLLRAISFTTSNHSTATAHPGVDEGVSTFRIANGFPTAPHFNWTADVTIHGNAGDPFGDFQVGPLQVLRSWWFNVWWGTGANRTHRKGTVATPIRDALTTGSTWYADALASANYSADGDVRSTGLNDSPGIPSTPIANPVAGRVSTRGWFNYGVAFVSYISARDTTAAGAGAFRHLAHVYWNLSLNGDLDTTRAAGSQVRLGTAATNASSVFTGASAAVPPITGGAVPNAAAVITTT